MSCDHVVYVMALRLRLGAPLCDTGGACPPRLSSSRAYDPAAYDPAAYFLVGLRRPWLLTLWVRGIVYK